MKRIILPMILFSNSAYATQLSYTQEYGKVDRKEFRSEEGTEHFQVGVGLLMFEKDQTKGGGITVSLIPRPVHSTYFDLRLPITVGGVGYHTQTAPLPECVRGSLKDDLDIDDDGDIDKDDERLAKDKLRREQEKIKEDTNKSIEDGKYGACKAGRDAGESFRGYGAGLFYEFEIAPAFKVYHMFISPSVGYREAHKSYMGEIAPKDLFSGAIYKISFGLEW